MDQLILAIAEGSLVPKEVEIRRVTSYLASLGFDISSRIPIGGRLEGVQWEGRVLRRGDLLTPAEIHYLEHVVDQQEWPSEITIEDYQNTIRELIEDPDSGLLISRWRNLEWHVTAIRRSGPLRGPDGHDWVMVEYRLGGGYWTTAFQPRKGLAHLEQDRRRTRLRWLRHPK